MRRVIRSAKFFPELRQTIREGWWAVARKCFGRYACPHLRIDNLGRCEDCCAWQPFAPPPPDRGPVKRSSELSILALDEPRKIRRDAAGNFMDAPAACQKCGNAWLDSAGNEIYCPVCGHSVAKAPPEKGRTTVNDELKEHKEYFQNTFGYEVCADNHIWDPIAGLSEFCSRQGHDGRHYYVVHVGPRPEPHAEGKCQCHDCVTKERERLSSV